MELFIVLGSCLLFLLVGVILLVKNINFVKIATKTTGEIVEVWDYQSTRNRVMYSSRIGFKTLTNESVVFENPSSSTIKPKIGKEVVVYYKEENPKKAKIGSIFQLYIIPVILIVLGLFTLLIFVSML